MYKYILLERVTDRESEVELNPLGIYTTCESLDKDYFDLKRNHSAYDDINRSGNLLYGFSYFSVVDNKIHALEVYRVEDRQLYRHVEKTVSILWPILCTILFLAILAGAFNN